MILSISSYEEDSDEYNDGDDCMTSLYGTNWRKISQSTQRSSFERNTLLVFHLEYWQDLKFLTTLTKLKVFKNLISIFVKPAIKEITNPPRTGIPLSIQAAMTSVIVPLEHMAQLPRIANSGIW